LGELNILVTGAAGFVGTAVVRTAKARGHIVRTLTRAQADLAVDDLGQALEGVDVVIHCAASLRGDDTTQARDTVLATTRLIAAMVLMTPKPKLILVSSMGVYAGDVPPNTLITEDSPLEPTPALRDAYTRAKLAQEQSVMAAGLPHCIARVGAVWGPGQLWNSHLGVAFGPVLIRLGAGGELPLAHVQNVALALVLAAESETGIINVVDDDRPSPRNYVAALTMGGWPKLVIPLSWRILDALTVLPLPFGLFRRPTLRARMMPRRYSNALLHALGWEPAIGFEAGMRGAR
jgi:nucleoside-diphosphate-sugar epimerase